MMFLFYKINILLELELYFLFLYLQFDKYYNTTVHNAFDYISEQFNEDIVRNHFPDKVINQNNRYVFDV